MLRRIVLVSIAALSLCPGVLAQAQPPGTSPPAAAPPAPAAPERPLSAAELEALIAPVALYPDALLSQVLMASTYPLEVVLAARWMSENPKLKGDELKAAVEKQPWDASVKALVAVPSVLKMMSDKLDWTQKLGDAMLAQQADVMGAVQTMRGKAYANDKLKSGSQQTVSVSESGGQRNIAIASTDENVVYVPYYDPAVVYGTWPYPETPPYYFPAPGYIAAGVIGTGLAFGAAYALGRWGYGNNYWGGNINWNNRNVTIDRDRVTHWQHNAQHRQGVRYGNSAVRDRFAGSGVRDGAGSRMDFRGRGDVGGNLGQRPGQPGRGDIGRPGRPGGDRVGGGGGQRVQRPAQRPAVSDRARGSRAGAARRGDSAFGNVQSRRAAGIQSQRGRASFASAQSFRGGHMGGGARFGGGGGGARFGGGGFGGRGGGGRGGGRRSDIAFKHDVVLLGHLANGLGFYRFVYHGSDVPYVGVIAQEVRDVIPAAVFRGPDGRLRVRYDQLGLRFETFEQWRGSGARIPAGVSP